MALIYNLKFCSSLSQNKIYCCFIGDFDVRYFFSHGTHFVYMCVAHDLVEWGYLQCGFLLGLAASTFAYWAILSAQLWCIVTKTTLKECVSRKEFLKVEENNLKSNSNACITWITYHYWRCDSHYCFISCSSNSWVKLEAFLEWASSLISNLRRILHFFVKR